MNLAIVKQWPWPWILTCLHLLNEVSSSFKFQGTGCTSFRRINVFTFSYRKNMNYKTWPGRKTGLVIYSTNYDMHEYSQLNTKFRENNVHCFREIFWRVLLLMGMVTTLVTWPWCREQTFVPPTHRGATQNLALIGRRRCLKIVEDEFDANAWAILLFNRLPNQSKKPTYAISMWQNRIQRFYSRAE